MTTITFDTQEAVIKLRAVGVSQEHDDAFVRAIVESRETLVTHDYLDNRLDKTLAPIYTDLAVLKADSTSIKWMIGVLIAGVMSIVIKTFF